VLGLLMMRDMTVYQLSKAFKASLALFYSASLGSLQRAVQKLLAQRLVSCRVTTEGGRRKKIYRILPAGRAAFRAGMKAPITPSRLEVTALSRLSFLGVLRTAREREEVLSLVTTTIAEALDGLVTLKTQLAGQEAPDAVREIYRFQVMTLDYGIMAHRAALTWFKGVTAVAPDRAGA
jgi:PadR family transcriptional regulator, regulatory protein AphA